MRTGEDEAPHGGTYNFTTVSLKKKKKSVNKSKFIIKRLYSVYKDLYVNIYIYVGIR